MSNDMSNEEFQIENEFFQNELQKRFTYAEMTIGVELLFGLIAKLDSQIGGNTIAKMVFLEIRDDVPSWHELGKRLYQAYNEIDELGQRRMNERN